MNFDPDDSISIFSVSNLGTNSTFRFTDCEREPTLRDLLYSIESSASRKTGLRMECETDHSSSSSSVSIQDEAKDFAESIRNTPLSCVLRPSVLYQNPECLIHDAYLGSQQLVQDLKKPLIPLHKSGQKRGEEIHRRRLMARETLLDLPVYRKYRLVQPVPGLPRISVELIPDDPDQS